jgi:hypothetical protein
MLLFSLNLRNRPVGQLNYSIPENDQIQILSGLGLHKIFIRLKFFFKAIISCENLILPLLNGISLPAPAIMLRPTGH